MIVELTVENLAIIERSQVHLGPGFTVLTGETGAGKSLLVDAIELALGERADSDLVRSGAARASVSLVIDLSGHAELRSECESLGLALEDRCLFISREVFAEGRSQCRIGGKLAPVSALRQIGQRLVDLHGQHDHQSLLHAERHLDFLDSWVGQDATEAKSEVKIVFEDFQKQQRKLASARSGRRDREQRLDMLRFQIQEIEAVSPAAGEMDELEQLLARLTNADKLRAHIAGALESLADGETPAIDLLGSSVKGAESAEKIDASVGSLLEPMRTALFALEDAIHELRNYSESLEFDPLALETTASRIDDLRRLRRKYGEDESAILQFLGEAMRARDELEGDEMSEEELEAACQIARENLVKTCARLTALRAIGAEAFSGLVQGQLQELAMDRAIFEVQITTKEPDETGADEVQFLFSANAGEPPRPLNKIASGGEISRVMLGIKSVMAGRAGVPTLIFDEVDTGLGGRAAAVVARKLEELARHYQVISISHLPQLASRATTHFRIEKQEVSGRVVTSVRELKLEERVEEIARMIDGDLVTESARQHAEQMLAAKA